MTVEKRKKTVFNDVDALVNILLMNREYGVRDPKVNKNIEQLTKNELKSKIVHLVSNELTNDLIDVNFNLSGNIMSIQPSFSNGESTSYFSDGKECRYKCMWEMTNEETIDQVVNEINESFLIDDEEPTMSNDVTEQSTEFEDPFANFFAPTRVFSDQLKKDMQRSLQNLFFESVSVKLTGDSSWDFPDSEFGEEWIDKSIATVYTYLDEPLNESDLNDAELENRFLFC